MFPTRFPLALLALLGALAVRLAPAAEEEKTSSQAATAALSAGHLEQFHKLLLPPEGELRWMEVPWRTSIALARREAAVEDKPLLVFADTGAGFADALGLC
jgi:hypothetical protein